MASTSVDVATLALDNDPTHVLGHNGAGEFVRSPKIGLVSTVLSIPRNPLVTDVSAGKVRVVKNTVTGRLSLWVNDGGTMIDLLVLTTD